MFSRNQTNIVKAVMLQLKVNLIFFKKWIAGRWQRNTAWSLREAGALWPGIRRRLVRLLERVAVSLDGQRLRYAAPPLQRSPGSQKAAPGALFSAVFLVGCPAALRAANRVCRPEAPPSLPASASSATNCCVCLLAPSTRMSRLLTELLLLL